MVSKDSPTSHPVTATRTRRVDPTPRVYLTLTDSKSKKSIGMTVRGLNKEQLAEKLESIFNGSQTAAA